MLARKAEHWANQFGMAASPPWIKPRKMASEVAGDARVINAPLGTDGGAERFPDRESEPERRFSHRFAFPDGSVLGRAVAEGGNLVRAGAVGFCDPPAEQIYGAHCNNPWEVFGPPEVSERVEWEVRSGRSGETLGHKYRYGHPKPRVAPER